MFSWNPHLRINYSRMDPRLPRSHDTIFVRPRGQKVLVLIPHIPFFWIPPCIRVCINVLKGIGLPILNLNLIAVTRVRVWVADYMSNPEWAQIAIYRSHQKKYPTYTSRLTQSDGRERSCLRSTNGASLAYSSRTVPSSIYLSSKQTQILKIVRICFVRSVWPKLLHPLLI